MAYDLLLRRQVSTDLTRGGAVLAAGGLLALLLVPRALRRSEVARYRQEYADDLARTQEMPTISMADLVRIPYRE
jgi:hypothetical protein